MNVDWLQRRVVIEIRPKVSERQELDRGARVIVTGLEWLVIDPPGPGVSPHYEPSLVGGYDVDSRGGFAREGLPEVPDGAFAHYFFLFSRNSFIHLCGRGATFEWTEDSPRSCDSTIKFPGDEI